jgi:HK97 gp10 family phage protein
MADAPAKVEGLAATTYTMGTLTDRFARKVMRKSLSRATKGLVGAVRRKIPVRSGLMKKSIGRKIKTYVENGVVLAIVGARRGFGGVVNVDGRQVYEDPAKIMHLVEFGTQPHSVAKDSQASQGNVAHAASLHPGSIAQPSLRPAYEEEKGRMEADYARGCQEGLAEELR